MPGIHRRNPKAALVAIIAIYSILSVAMSMLSGKVGAEASYYDEVLCLCCIWCGVSIAMLSSNNFFPKGQLIFGIRVAAVAPVTGALLPLVLSIQVLTGIWRADLSEQVLTQPSRIEAQASLLKIVENSPRPALTDDLTLPLLAGKQPLIEPFVFTQLAKAGRWNEQPLLRMLNGSCAIDTLITNGLPGDAAFDERYSPAMVAAMRKYYPDIETVGLFSVWRQHCPPDPSAAATLQHHLN
jgi:hypothetical protein